jgi:hypothetical protein
LHDRGLKDATDRLHVGRVMRETLSLVARTAGPLARVWLAMAVVNFVGDLLEGQGAVEEGARLAVGVGEAIVVGVCSMAAVRTMLQVPGAWRLDRGGLTFAAVDMASSLALMAWYAATPTIESHLAVLKVALWVAGGLAVWWVFIRIALWTYAKALREPGVTLEDSWRRMRGAAGAILGASVALAILPGQGIELLTQQPASLQGAARLAMGLLSAAGSAAFSVMIVAVPAAVYRLRGGAQGDALARVFE